MVILPSDGNDTAPVSTFFIMTSSPSYFSIPKFPSPAMSAQVKVSGAGTLPLLLDLRNTAGESSVNP